MTPQEREEQLAATLEVVHRGANWFYWIVGLSLVNLALAVAESNYHFLIGLSMSELASGFIVMKDEGSLPRIMGIALVSIILGGYLFIGKRAHAPSKPAFIIGMVVYAIDGVIYLGFQDYLPAAFHAYVIYNFYMGYKGIDDYLAVLNTETIEAEIASPVAEETVPALAAVSAAGAVNEEDPYKPL